jgi:CHAT domain-containing protein
LPYSRQEAEAILALVEPDRSYRALGFEARREAVLNPSLGRYSIVHMATHGVLDTEHPELTHLVFSRFNFQGQPRRNLVFAHEIYGLDLPVNLVVLSACETALGREMRGEGLVGLTQGFLQAGANAVVVSLWQVDDRVTAELMTRFYRALLVDGQGPAEALRQAQLSIRRETAWHAPYYWAGFLFQGDWRAFPEDLSHAKPSMVGKDLDRSENENPETPQED